jgi:hypothetical protein
MFTERDLRASVAAVHEARDPTLVLDCATDFETLPPEQAEELGLVVDRLDPASYPDAWLPPDAPDLLRRYAGGEFTVGMPGDGSVAWTRQTDPPVVLCKPRLEGSPEDFADFLVAEAVVQATLGEPEHFLPFFGDRYPDFAAAVAGHLGPVETYQLAAACYDAYLGLHTRDTFAGWEGGETDPLFRTWLDAGERLTGRLDGLAGAVARGETAFPDAAELACSGVKHALDVPAPFDALDAEAYRDAGADYAVRWAEKTVDSLD